MSELIDKKALLDECLNHYEVGNIEQNCTMDWICKTVRNFPAASPWHRVEDGLPDDGFIGKLVCDDEGQISICHGFATVTLANGKVVYTDSRIFDVFGEETDLWDDVTHFTHWMTIEPPKEDA